MAIVLTYAIFEGTLTGSTGGTWIRMEAWSGGAGGSTRRKRTADVNNPYSEGVIAIAQVAGGPLPPGKYLIEKPAHHGKHGLSARLIPQRVHMMGRTGGFMIHGSGPLGSDGCIVPMHAADFSHLMQVLTAEGGGTLYVQESEDGSMFG